MDNEVRSIHPTPIQVEAEIEMRDIDRLSFNKEIVLRDLSIDDEDKLPLYATGERVRVTIQRSITIKRCPFCGGIATLEHTPDNGVDGEWSIVCNTTSCQAEVCGDSPEQAAFYWNRRVSG